MSRLKAIVIAIINSVKQIIDVNKGLIRFITKKENLSVALKMASIGSDIYSKLKPKQAKKIKTMITTLKVIQKSMDESQSMTDNDETLNLVDKINSDENNHKWGNFTAEFVKNKHGEGNSGINLGIKTKVFDKDLKINYDPKDGSASVELGMLKFKL